MEIGGLTPRPPVGIGDGLYRAWEAREVPPGPGVELRLDGLPQPGAMARVGRTLSGGSFWMTAIPSAMGAALLALLALGLARRYRPVAAAESVPSPSGGGLGWGCTPAAEFAEAGAEASRPGDDAPPSQRAGLVARLASLDEQYQQGGMDEEDYLRQRAELVSRALGESPDDEE